MSGVFGMLRFDGQPVLPGELRAMGTALRDHGPDGRGQWDGGVCASVGLGHVAMHLTPEDALDAQPLVDRDTGLVLVADARLDNRADLTRCLALAPQRARGMSDAGLILEAYKTWGRDCPAQLRGDFAFLVWDSARRILFCARDPFGVRSLFYHRSSRCLVLASAPKGLFALPEVPRRLDARKLADALVLVGDAETTFYEDVRRLAPAHWLAAQDGDFTVRRYWRLEARREVRLASDGAYVECLRELFDDAVRSRLRSAHPVGAFLSGGLDSSSVACVAARRLGLEGHLLPTFTAVPREGFAGVAERGWYNDETPFVEDLRRAWPNLEPHYVRAAGRTPLDDLERHFAALEAPLRNPDNRVWLDAIRAEARDRGIRILLNGQGGNATISFDGRTLLGELFRRGRWWRLHTELRALARARRRSRRALLSQHVLGPWRAAIAWPGADHGASAAPWSRYSAIRPEFAEESHINARLRELGCDPAFRPPRAAQAWRIGWIEDGAAQDASDLTQAWRAHFGIETRDPTMDQRVVEFCLAIPTDQYLRGGIDRYLIRRAMVGTLPPSVLWKTERGAQEPGWYERIAGLREEIEAEIAALERNPTARHCLDLPRMRRLVERWPEGDWDGARHAYEYRYLLLRGLIVGRFIRWVEERGRQAVVDPDPDACRAAVPHAAATP